MTLLLSFWDINDLGERLVTLLVGKSSLFSPCLQSLRRGIVKIGAEWWEGPDGLAGPVVYNGRSNSNGATDSPKSKATIKARVDSSSW